MSRPRHAPTLVALLLGCAPMTTVSISAAAPAPAPRTASTSQPRRAAGALQQRADRFLELVNAGYQALYAVDSRAQWDAATDVTPEHDAASAATGKAKAAFDGNPVLIREARALLEHAAELDPVTVRQLHYALYNAAEGPMTRPELVAARVEAETRQASTLNGFTFKLDGKPISANDIDDQLVTLTDPARRRAVWEASKLSGPALKPGLLELQGLRNGVAQELGFHDYFSLQAAKYDMSADQLVRQQEDFLRELKPLYLQIHTWARYELAKRYHQPVPKRLPADWLPDRWAQDWSPMLPAASLDEQFKGRSAEWIMRTAEGFYTGMGFPTLPASFWTRSDLYALKPTDTRKKNTHASCWHVDLDHDIRGLLNVEPNTQWFQTAHHELGHGHYFMSYTRPEVPPLLRDGPNPGFHEGMGELISLASMQTPYLESLGVLTPATAPDSITALLRDALYAVPFMFWASGTMTHWEADFYAHDLPAGQLNARWWAYAAEFQGIEPPAPRGEEFCDAATKTHINDTPAYYPAYAVATVLKFQLHDHIARAILGQDPRSCSYANDRRVGEFLMGIMRQGATRDWHVVLREATGEDLSTRAMLDYFRPLMAWLERENRGRPVGWE